MELVPLETRIRKLAGIELTQPAGQPNVAVIKVLPEGTIDENGFLPALMQELKERGMTNIVVDLTLLMENEILRAGIGAFFRGISQASGINDRYVGIQFTQQFKGSHQDVYRDNTYSSVYEAVKSIQS